MVVSGPEAWLEIGTPATQSPRAHEKALWLFVGIRYGIAPLGGDPLAPFCTKSKLGPKLL